MRGEYMRQILKGADVKVINTDVPMEKTSRLFRSVGWRFKKGPFITNINEYITESLKGDYKYDLVWIDKGVFIKPVIISKLKEKSARLVHFTPDPAFAYHQSKFFYEALPYYDYCITTKSYELTNYQSYGTKTIFCTQGYDPALHKPHYSFERKKGLIFIGHLEKERQELVEGIVKAGIQITVAGNHWDKFYAKLGKPANLIYKGTGIFGTDYARELSRAQIGLGFLSKWVPELHTTRTIEIPACGTALMTEKTPEIDNIFSQKEVIYFKDEADMLGQIKYFMDHTEELRSLSLRGYERITGGGYSYGEIMKRLLDQVCSPS
jgi:hypothetical protein